MRSTVTDSTGFRRTPIPSISDSMTSPGKIGPAIGLAVVMRSPGSSVQNVETKATMSSNRKIILEVLDSASTFPFRRRRIRRLYISLGISSGVTIHGPIGP